MEYDNLLTGDISFAVHSRPRIQKLCYGMGHVYNDLCAAVWFSYTLFYLQIVLQLEPTTAGALVMLGQVVDAVATPGAGWAVDRIGTPQAWHLAGTASVATGFSLLFSIPLHERHWWSLVWYGGLIILFQIGWATVQISHLSIIPIISKDHNHSSDLTTIRYTASVCCGIAVYLITWMVLKNNPAAENIGPQDFSKFRDIVLILTFIGISACVVFYCGTRWTNGYHFKDVNETGISKEAQKPINPLKSLIVYQISLLYVASRLYTILNLIYIPLYLDEKHVTNPPSNDSQLVDGIRQTIASVPLVSFVSSFITSIFLKCKANCCNDKTVYLIGALFSLLGCLCIAFNNFSNTNYFIYVIAIFVGIGSSSTMISSLCLTAELVQTNGFRGGSVYSAVTFTDKLISGAIVLITQNLNCQNPETCPNFYRDVLAYVCGGAVSIGLISLLLLIFKK